MAKSFSFPVLDKKEICQHLSELGAPKLSLDNLISPSPEAVLPVYDFLSSFYFKSREESLQPGFEAIQLLGDYHELHLDSYVLHQSITRIRNFMAAAGAEGFSVIIDLYRPESQRTLRFLSAAINYIRHSNCRVPFIAQLVKQRDESIAKLEEIKEEQCKIESDIAQIEQERAAERPKVEALEIETKELNNKIQAFNKQQLGMQLEINNLKQEDASILDKISNMDFETMQKQQEGARIRSQVVENPKELQKLLQEKKSALIEEEALGMNALESCRAWKAKVEVISKAEKKILKHQMRLQAFEEQINDRNADKIVKERRTRVKAIEKEQWSLDAKKDDLYWGVRRLEEHSEKHSKQCNEASKELQAAKALEEQCSIDRNSRQDAVSEQDKQAEALQRMHAEILAFKANTVLRFEASANKLAEALRTLPKQAVRSSESMRGGE